MNSEGSESQVPFKYASPEEAYAAARKRIVGNAFRRRQSSLDLSNFGLTHLPAEIGQLDSLQNLNISNNQLIKLPSEIGKMVALRDLNASVNKLTNLPASIGNLQNLASLNLDHNELTTIPVEIGQLTHLSNLSLDGNQIFELAPSIGELSHLSRLDIDNNKLSGLPNQFLRLTNLDRLYLNGNDFSEFPDVVTKLPKLRSLLFGSNRLTAIPESISKMKSLRRLYLSSNLIENLPVEIAELTLERLDVASNRLTKLPGALGTMVSLEEKLGEDFESVTYGLSITGNPLLAPYPTLISLGQPQATKNVLAWLRGELDPSNLESAQEKTAEPTPPPTEPSEEAGPTFHLADGQIDLVQGFETSSDFDRAIQETLHQRLRRQIEVLREATSKVGNQHPQLVTVVDEYAKLVHSPTTELDVVNLWAAGNALMAQASAFQHQDRGRTLSEPLEPLHLGLLKEISALHGGFILGFPTAAKLTDRADRSRVSPEIIRTIGPSTSNVLSALSRQRRLLSERARQLIEAIDAPLLMGSWDAARIGYTGYATLRNALVAIGRICVWINDKGGSLAGGILVGSAVAAANLPPDTLHLVMLFLRSNSADILSFAAPFPELRVYVEWVIDHFDYLKDEAKTAIDDESKPSSNYFLFREAILSRQQIVCAYDGSQRELCPYVIGSNKNGEEVVLAWQFAGEGSGKLPQWRCLKLSNVKNARAREGRWHESDSYATAQTCVSNVDLDINIHVRG